LEEGSRKGQRVVIYPKYLPQLEAVLSTGDPSIDSEDGHPIAYAMSRSPLFLREDNEQITKDPIMGEKVPGWMNTAAKVATGNRRRVLENGPDVMNSDEEDALKEEHGDVLEGMYTPGMDPEKGPVKLTQAQVAAQKAAAKALPLSQTPVSGSSDEDEPSGSEYVWSQTKGCMRKNKNYRKAATVDSKTSVLPPAPIRLPTPVNSDTEDQGDMTEDQKRCARGGKKRSQKASTQPTKGQESPKPMETRGQAASRAGGLRGAVGSGSTGYVCDKRPPSFKPGSQSFSSAEVFLPHPSQQVQWNSETTVSRFGCWAVLPRITALRAVVRCSKVPRWGQTK
jgi:hypothetical protein